MDSLKKFMIVLNNPDKYPTEHELAEAALVARDKINRLIEQRDAALKLADELENEESRNYGYESKHNGYTAAGRIRAIFEPKERA